MKRDSNMAFIIPTASEPRDGDMDHIDSLVSSLTNDMGTQDLLNSNGLRAHSVTWEDTGRSKGSCWGPNISDMTLVTKKGNKLMPVIRKPNFSDVTNDVPIDTFKLLVGNEDNSGNTERKVVKLREFLQDISHYTNNPHKVDLTDTRDDVVLTSSQCCVLPVSRGNKTEFALQLFNYQSYNDDPAVLVILVTKDGVSTQVLERSNTKLFFNDKGTARWLNVERLQDKRERETGQKQDKIKSFTEMKTEEKMDNVLMMFQVPLERKQVMQPRGMQLGGSLVFLESACCELGVVDGCSSSKKKCKKVSGMDMGMLNLGSVHGAYTGTKGLVLKRDKRFPIRCTFQYYRVTDQNYIDESDVKDIAEQLDQATKVALASGSLVFSDPETSQRKTEPDLTKMPSDIWKDEIYSLSS